jgi:hypothetical protein
MWRIHVTAVDIIGISDISAGAGSVGGVGVASVAAFVRGTVSVAAHRVSATIGAANATTDMDVGASVGCIGAAFYSGSSTFGPSVVVYVTNAHVQHLGIVHSATGSIQAATGAVGVASSTSCPLEQVTVEVESSTFAIGPIGFTTVLGRTLNSAVGGVGVAISMGTVSNVSVRVAGTNITASTMRAVTGIFAAVGTVGVAATVVVGNVTVIGVDSALLGLRISTSTGSSGSDAPTIVGGVGAAGRSGGFGTVRIATVNCSVTASPILHPSASILVPALPLAVSGSRSTPPRSCWTVLMCSSTPPS